jgi:hypothetical protein
MMAGYISSSFRGDAEHRTRNLEIPGLVLTHHPGMTEGRYAFAASPTISGCCASETAGDIRITSACAPKIATAR